MKSEFGIGIGYVKVVHDVDTRTVVGVAVAELVGNLPDFLSCQRIGDVSALKHRRRWYSPRADCRPIQNWIILGIGVESRLPQKCWIQC